MVSFDRQRMKDHVTHQDEGYGQHDEFAIRNSTLILKSRIHKELFLVSLIAEELRENRPVVRLLEVGCGIGTLTPALRSIADEVVAFDLSPAGVEFAEQSLEGWPGIRLCVADGTAPRGEPVIAEGEFDIILIREFHPFTRDFYADRREANRVHEEVLAEYVSLLAPKGLLLISHAEDKEQTIRPEELVLPADVEYRIARVDPRLLAAFLFLTRNRLGPAIRLTRLAQLALWSLVRRNVLYVLQRS